MDNKILLLVAASIVSGCSIGVGLGVGIERQQNNYEIRGSDEARPPSLAAMTDNARVRGDWAKRHGLPIERNPYGESVYLDGEEVGDDLSDAWMDGWSRAKKNN